MVLSKKSLMAMFYHLQLVLSICQQEWSKTMAQATAPTSSISTTNGASIIGSTTTSGTTSLRSIPIFLKKPSNDGKINNNNNNEISDYDSSSNSLMNVDDYVKNVIMAPYDIANNNLNLQSMIQLTIQDSIQSVSSLSQAYSVYAHFIAMRLYQSDIFFDAWRDLFLSTLFIGKLVIVARNRSVKN